MQDAMADLHLLSTGGNRPGAVDVADGVGKEMAHMARLSLSEDGDDPTCEENDEEVDDTEVTDGSKSDEKMEEMKSGWKNRNKIPGQIYGWDSSKNLPSERVSAG